MPTHLYGYFVHAYTFAYIVHNSDIQVLHPLNRELKS